MRSMRVDTDDVHRCFSVIHHEGEEEYKDDDSDYIPSEQGSDFDAEVNQALLILEEEEVQTSAATPHVSPQTPSVPRPAACTVRTRFQTLAQGLRTPMGLAIQVARDITAPARAAIPASIDPPTVELQSETPFLETVDSSNDCCGVTPVSDNGELSMTFCEYSRSLMAY